MSRIDQLFAELRGQKRKAFMPFVTAGDPDLAFTADVIRELDRRGATMCEVGVPYSDPIADGPVIQASYTRALSPKNPAQKIKVPAIFDMLRGVSAQVKMPLVTMVPRSEMADWSSTLCMARLTVRRLSWASE